MAKKMRSTKESFERLIQLVKQGFIENNDELLEIINQIERDFNELDEDYAELDGILSVKDKLISTYRSAIHHKGIGSLKDFEIEIPALIYDNLYAIGETNNFEDLGRVLKKRVDNSIEALREAWDESIRKRDIMLTSKQFRAQMRLLKRRLKRRHNSSLRSLTVRSVMTDAEPGTIDNDLVVCVQEFVEDCVRNSIEHGQASNVVIDVRFDEKRCFIAVTDDGKGFDNLERGGKKKHRPNSHPTGHGLSLMARRLEEYHGGITKENLLGQGCTVEMYAIYKW